VPVNPREQKRVVTALLICRKRDRDLQAAGRGGRRRAISSRPVQPSTGSVACFRVQCKHIQLSDAITRTERGSAHSSTRQCRAATASRGLGEWVGGSGVEVGGGESGSASAQLLHTDPLLRTVFRGGSIFKALAVQRLVNPRLPKSPLGFARRFILP
jgi:hypothetical protein